MKLTLTVAACAAVLLLASMPVEVFAAPPSSRVCDAWARDYARAASRQGQTVRRGLLGGVIGLGIGAATGGAAAGAAIGGGVGAISGGAQRQRTFDQIYAAAYRDCMRGKAR